MIHALLTLLIALLPFSPVVRDRCDIIEVNHFYDEHGKLVFDQVIFRDWNDSLCDFNVAAWRMLKRPAQLPVRAGNGWRATWMENGLLRRVEAAAMRESWSQTDPELIDRDVWPKEMRRELGVRP